MNIYKNFLDKKTFTNSKEKIMSDQMPWYFNDGVNKIPDENFQFTFVFLDENGINCSKEMMDIINPILKKIKYNKLRAVKANLLTQTKDIVEHGYHIDQEKGTTGIFYLDNSNGYTKFKNGKIIKSEENKYVEFDSTLKHTGSTCTDTMRRVVINFNYEYI
tara:strand:+ start:41 stop:523 length:483 start_codon:yes stop_codon:yes gene_type:complete